MQVNITLGTAGHIDHGKTALVKCLTGCDTDYLKIEKERGMSIELGFAPCTISGLEVGIVDVPGHEHFIKTMVAGATGIDGVIFVIAADDGIMPQTLEHMDILTMLGLKHGIVALTKADCVSPDRLEQVSSQIRQFLPGTFLETAPIVPVSSITAAGFDTLLDALHELVDSIRPKPTDGVFRLPVEKIFSVKGYGTVVTGIPAYGAASTGDEVILLPGRHKGRIKSIQVYNRPSRTVLCGQCTALNIPQLDHQAIERGHVVSVGDYFAPSLWYLCSLQTLAGNNFQLKNGTTLKFHTGTAEVTATAFLLEKNILGPGEQSLVQFRLDKPVVAGPADRFIARISSPPATIGGGIIVEAIEKKIKRTDPQALADALARCQALRSESDFAQYCISAAPEFGISFTDIALRAKILPAKLRPVIEKLRTAGSIIEIAADFYIHSKTRTILEQKILDIVQAFHRTSPQSPGITPELLLQQSALRKNLFDAIIAGLAKDGKIISRKSRLALAGHTENFDNTQQELMNRIEQIFLAALFNPPSPQDIADSARLDKASVEKTIGFLIEQQKLIRIEADLYFHPQALEQARRKLVDFIRQNGCLESVKFKYLLDTSRKYAIPLLDYMDKIGITKRQGHTRYLKNP